jgi:hypothetical protein
MLLGDPMLGLAMIWPEITARARALVGAGPASSLSFVDGLGRFMEEAHSAGPPQVKVAMETAALDSLAARFRAEKYIDQNRYVLELPVRSPLFVLGMPRTGTTLLSQLLDLDPSRRSLLQWELLHPVPPPRTETLRTDDRCMALLKQQNELLRERPDLAMVHWEFANEPTECTELHLQDFKALSLFPAPNYNSWVIDCDMTSAYQYQKSILQMRQSTAPGRWVLKMPCHALYIPYLINVFPDARLIWAHRDPYRALASFCSLVRFYQQQSGLNPDLASIARQCIELAQAIIDRPRSARKNLARDQIYDLHYCDLLRDPIGEVRRIYLWLGEVFPSQLEDHMRRWLATHAQHRFGKHRYSLSEFGLEIEDLRPLFDGYVGEYAVQLE